MFKISKGNILLLKIETLGKLSLYSSIKTVVYSDFNYSGGNMTPRVNGSDTYTIYYFGEDDTTVVSPLRNEKDDAKIYNKFFKKCKVFVDLSLEERKKLNGMKGAVEFFNKNCTN
ncbi:hypothetical protein P8625_04120 [Tenacibaculum tangerinum]|uniref:Uncharacterized protein n=1 Tax=Tenacibaculum tangerinum TaxID=3038772 RepID=A0ABY8L4K7_9FLAO|nr:hypothetical protein [Tenacibaculum tangerinum]WGH76359.1 hypothetical protein P8625_04120 [Tenacibaculum tangerinum]